MFSNCQSTISAVQGADPGVVLDIQYKTKFFFIFPENAELENSKFIADLFLSDLIFQSYFSYKLSSLLIFRVHTSWAAKLLGLTTARLIGYQCSKNFRNQLSTEVKETPVKPPNFATVFVDLTAVHYPLMFFHHRCIVAFKYRLVSKGSVLNCVAEVIWSVTSW